MNKKIYAVYQRSKIDRTCNMMDYEDVLILSKAYIDELDSIIINGRKISIYKEELFQIFDVSEKFSSIDHAKNELKKQFNFYSKGVPTEEGVAQHGSNVTKEILKTCKELNLKDTNKVSPPKTNVMRNKIFISHASDDKQIVDIFVNLVLKLGLEIKSERIFCSSMAGHGVKSGKDIPDELKEEILKSSIVFLFTSKNYKNSPVCLNELGGAWISLDKEKIIPILLPDADFKELGFLDSQRLSKKITEEGDIIGLIQDLKEELNLDINIPLLNVNLRKFINEVSKLHLLDVKAPFMKEPKEISEWDRCFNRSLHPFGLIFCKTVPHLSHGIHQINDKTIINNILTELASIEYVNEYWYKFAGGDYYLKDMELLSNGNWIIGGWELNISELQLSIDSSHQNEFILLKTHKMPPYKIESDVGGESYEVGIMNSGKIVSENERGNGYTIINGKSIDLHKFDTQLRYCSDEDHWIFLCTYYHKVGCNPDQSIEFAKKLDKGKIKVTPENLKKFLRGLSNNITVIQHM
jgi:hypothetical protein